MTWLLFYRINQNATSAKLSWIATLGSDFRQYQVASGSNSCQLLELGYKLSTLPING